MEIVVRVLTIVSQLRWSTMIECVRECALVCGSSAGPLGGLVKGKAKSVSLLDPSTAAHAERVHLIAFCRNLIFEATSSRKPALARGNRMAGSIGERTTKLKSEFIPSLPC